jgi:hypothetical protein
MLELAPPKASSAAAHPAGARGYAPPAASLYDAQPAPQFVYEHQVYVPPREAAGFHNPTGGSQCAPPPSGIQFVYEHQVYVPPREAAGWAAAEEAYCVGIRKKRESERFLGDSERAHAAVVRDFPRDDCSPYSQVHARRESFHRSRTVFCSPPWQTLPRVTISQLVHRCCVHMPCGGPRLTSLARLTVAVAWGAGRRRGLRGRLQRLPRRTSCCSRRCKRR